MRLTNSTNSDGREPTAVMAAAAALVSAISPIQIGGVSATTGLPWLDLLQEQQRQIHAEGFTDVDDDRHAWGELAAAAACYALVGMLSDEERAQPGVLAVPDAWPFDAEWWKPRTAREDLVRAGALILAELARRARMAQSDVGA